MRIAAMGQTPCVVGCDIDGVLAQGFRPPVDNYVVVSGRLTSEWGDTTKLLGTDRLIYLRPSGKYGDRQAGGEWKAEICHRAGLTDFYEDDPVQAAIIARLCPTVRVYLVARDNTCTLFHAPQEPALAQQRRDVGLTPFGVVFGGMVVNVVDGDTLDVEVRRTIRIRLLDCWAPESRTRDLEEKARGMAAKQALVKLAMGRRCRVVVPIEGDERFGEAMSMGRVLGRVEVEEGDISEYMVNNGFATKEKE